MLREANKLRVQKCDWERLSLQLSSNSLNQVKEEPEGEKAETEATKSKAASLEAQLDQARQAGQFLTSQNPAGSHQSGHAETFSLKQ